MWSKLLSRIHLHKQLQRLLVWTWEKRNSQLQHKLQEMLHKHRSGKIQGWLISSMLILLLLKFQKKHMKIIDILRLISLLEQAKKSFPRLTKRMHKHLKKIEIQLLLKMLLSKLPQKDIKMQSKLSPTLLASLIRQELTLSTPRGQSRNTSENIMQL